MSVCPLCDSEGPFLRTPRYQSGHTKHCLVCLHSTELQHRKADRKPSVTFVKERRMFAAEKAREKRLIELYGITLPDYWRLFDAQDGACAICRQPRRKHLEVDHDHKLERDGWPLRDTVRGLLCRACNGRLLPTVRDNVDTLNNAVNYLVDPPARGVLDVQSV